MSGVLRLATGTNGQYYALWDVRADWSAFPRQVFGAGVDPSLGNLTYTTRVDGGCSPGTATSTPGLCLGGLGPWGTVVSSGNVLRGDVTSGYAVLGTLGLVGSPATFQPYGLQLVYAYTYRDPGVGAPIESNEAVVALSATAIPEPTTITLTLSGLAVIGAGAWRRHRAYV